MDIRQITNFSDMVNQDIMQIESAISLMEQRGSDMLKKLNKAHTFKNLIQSYKILASMMRRVIKMLSVIKEISTISVLDLECAYDNLNKSLQSLFSLLEKLEIKKDKEVVEEIEVKLNSKSELTKIIQDQVCSFCYNYMNARKLVECEYRKYHPECINYLNFKTKSKK